MNETVKTRFAPSPTGRLHLGNVRTALFNWLMAGHHGGVFLVRFEDTDLERSAREYEPRMLEDLRWLGLQWHEGPEVGGDHGPYRQSQRAELYNRHFARLEAQGLVYPCFCKQEELQLARKAQMAAGQPPRYPGTCAHLSAEQVEAKRAQGLTATLRFRVPHERRIEFDDLVRGPQHFAGRDIGDFVIRRSDGTPAFFFSNAVDDALMGVTHVLRGEDHLTNTPRQLLLLEALGLDAPRYGHTSMLMASDGGPLSKRHGSRSVQELYETGYLPEAVVNYLSRLGHHYPEEHWMSLEELARGFSVERLGRSPARYDDDQLLHWQKEAVSRASDERLWEWMRSHAGPDGVRVDQWVPGEQAPLFVRAVRENISLPGDALEWAHRIFADVPGFSDVARAAICAAGRGFFEQALECMGPEPEAFRDYAKRVGEAAGVKGKHLFMPLRAALTGETHGPEMGAVWPLLGSASLRRRLKSAAELCDG